MRAKFHHISVFVEDMERSLKLFQDFLGFRLDWRVSKLKDRKVSTLVGIPDFECELAYLTASDQNVSIELSHRINPAMRDVPVKFGHTGTVGLSLSVENIDTLFEKLKSAGWDPISPILDLQTPEGKARVFCVNIEDCILLELIESKLSTG